MNHEARRNKEKRESVFGFLVSEDFVISLPCSPSIALNDWESGMDAESEYRFAPFEVTEPSRERSPERKFDGPRRCVLWTSR